MHISINLATRPFVELRPLYARLRLAMAALALLATVLGIGLHLLGGRARAAQAQMNALQAKTSAFQRERRANERQMEQPRNRAVLERAKFLNALFAEKSFSWTSVMMDLEQVLPTGVQVTSIEPVITAEGDVNIRLRVSGERDRAVELVRNLEQSRRFLTPRLANETAQTQEPGRVNVMAQGAAPGVEFDILSGYNPLPPAREKALAEKDAVAADKTATHAPHTEHKTTPRTAPSKTHTAKSATHKATAATHQTKVAAKGGVR